MIFWVVRVKVIHGEYLLGRKFNLNVHQGATLTISFVGFESASVKASPKMHVVLRENNKLLDEVLVIGYGTSKRKDVTTSVSSVSTKTWSSVLLYQQVKLSRVKPLVSL